LADDNLQVKIGADASDLAVKLALASAQLSKFQSDAKSLAAEMISAGNAADSGLRQKLGGLIGSAASTREEIAALKKEIEGIGDAIEKGTGGSHASGIGRVVFEVHALFDELSSGRAHQAVGTFSNLIYILSGINPMFAAVTAGAVGLGLALFEAARYFQSIKKTADEMRQALAFSGNYGIVDPKVLDAAAEKLRSLKGLISGIGEKDVGNIGAAFAQMGDVSNETIQAMALDMSTMWQQFGENEKEAAKGIVEVFSRPLAPIEEISKRLHGLTEAEREQIKAAQETNDPLKAQAAIQEVLAQRAKQDSADRIQKLDALIAKTREAMAESTKLGDVGYARDQKDYLDGLLAQLDAVKQINQSIADMAEKMRLAVSPAQNLQGAFRDMLKETSPQQVELQKLDEKIAQVRSTLGAGASTSWPPQGVTWGDSGRPFQTASPNENLSDRLREAIEKLSTTFGAFTINYATEGGHAKNSEHYSGNAIDVSTRGWDADRYTRAITDAIKAGFTGIGISGTHLHLDTRPSTSGAQIFPDAAGDNSPVFGKTPQEWAAAYGGQKPEATPTASSPLSPEQTQQATTALNDLLDKQRKLKEEIAGTNAMEQARNANLEREVVGKRDEVAEQKAVVAAAEAAYNAASGAAEKERARTELLRANVDLRAKEAAVEESSLALAVQRAGNDAKARLAAEEQLYAFRRQQAGEDAATQNRLLEEIESKRRAAAEEDRAIQEKSIQDQIKAVQDQAQQDLKNLADVTKNHGLTENEKLAQSRARIQQELDAERALYEQLAQLPLTTAKQKQDILDQEVAAERRATDQIAQLNRESADASHRVWQSLGNDLSSALNSQVSGLLRGTTSWAQALKNVLADFVTQAIEGFVKLAVNFALQQTVMNQAATTGAALRLAADQTAASGGIAALVANAIKAVTVDAGQTFAGVAAFLAPTLGPAALGPAAAAAASVTSAGAAVASADIGMWNVPSDQLAMIHKNELIMPAPEAGALRDMLSNAASGGGGAGGDTHNHTWNIVSNAADARDVAREVANLWTRNPSMRPGY
jgi:hypothetical protein